MVFTVWLTLWLSPQEVLQLLLPFTGYMSQQVFSIHQNPKEVGSNTSEEMNFQEELGKAGKEKILPFSTSFV